MQPFIIPVLHAQSQARFLAVSSVGADCHTISHLETSSKQFK